MNSPVTMQDIASLVGVSTATVSLSLRNRPNVSVELRARVQTLARELGYKPNPYVSALMRTRRNGARDQHSPVLALVHGLKDIRGWRTTSSITLRLIRQGIIARAQSLGYSTEEFSLVANDMSPKRLSDILLARGVRGVLLGPLPDGVLPPMLEWEKFSVIGIGLPHPTVPMHVVSNDHYFSMLRIMQECHHLGYRRPGLVMRTSHRAKFQGRWEAGFHSGQQMLPGLAPVAAHFGENPEEAAHFSTKAFRDWFKHEEPDAIIAVAPQAVEAGLKTNPPNPFRVVGLASLASPNVGSRFSGIFPNGELIGATAIELLVARVERNELGLPAQAIATMVEGVWNPGKTLIARNRVKSEIS